MSEFGNSAETALLKWADAAMVPAEPHGEGGPRVYLLNATPDPLGQIAAMWAMYTGTVVRSLDEITDEQRLDAWREIMKTRIKTALEAIQFNFLIEGVSRAFTHQIVRTRTGTYAQESLRFAVVEELENAVVLPPSLYGTHPESDGGLPTTKKQEMRMIWDMAIRTISEAYNVLVNSGMPAEDARGLLPTNVKTRLHVRVDVRTLLGMLGDRLCTQAQYEWRLVAAEMVRAIRQYQTHGQEDGWQFEQIANIFAPICYQTGKCEFNSNTDRPCSIRDRVNAYHKAGITSEQWNTTSTTSDGRPLLPIDPREWLADPNAAR